MTNIDDVRVHFEPGQLDLLNYLLAFIMYGVALDIRLDDFRTVFARPKAPIIGLMCQYLLFPAVTLILIWIFRPPASVGLGMALVAACPSGNIANFATHLARANVALSVILNSVIMLAAPFLAPFVFSAMAHFVPGVETLQQSIEIKPLAMLVLMVRLVLVPVLLGIATQRFFPSLTEKLRKPIKILSLVLFFGVVIAALAGNFENIKDHLHRVFIIVLIHNAVAMALGYWAGRSGRLTENDCRTLAFESGVHNTGLGLLLIFSLFGGLGGMAVVAAWYGIWDMITVFTLAYYWSKGRLL